MLKKTITFMNLDDEPVTHTFYFNMTQQEVLELEATTEGGFVAKLQNMLTGNPTGLDLMNVLRLFIEKSVGQRSEDNLSFEKSDYYTQKFMSMDAYNVLMTEFLKDAKNIAEFISGILPKNLRDKIDIETVMKEAEARVVGEGPRFPPAENLKVHEMVLDPASQAGNIERVNKLDEYTDQELQFMPLEELNRRIAREAGNVPKHILLLAMSRNNAEK